jgi:wyosine [tRNA(Phe)-imidazoG37] synthetase (radical SAM superfamily)
MPGAGLARARGTEAGVSAAVPALPRTPEEFVGTAFGRPREFLQNRYVYAVISPRARGLSIGVNLNPDKRCNFDCVYCEVERHGAGCSPVLDLDTLAAELEATLHLVNTGGLQALPTFAALPPELMTLRHVTLSGDGEPTLCPQFREVVETVTHIRALRRPFFKLVLITNASHLHAPNVFEGVRLLTGQDEVWAKLDAGTQAGLDRVNHAEVSLDQILANILLVARQRDVVIQSAFPSVNRRGPDLAEIQAYASQLKRLRENGARITLVQVYSATRPTNHRETGHLPLRTLSEIAQAVRKVAGLRAEVF